MGEGFRGLTVAACEKPWPRAEGGVGRQAFLEGARAATVGAWANLGSGPIFVAHPQPGSRNACDAPSSGLSLDLVGAERSSSSNFGVFFSFDDIGRCNVSSRRPT